MEELKPGLRRWTAPHPAWVPGADWPKEVGCVYYETSPALVLIDPLVPANDEQGFWAALDRDVERHDGSVLVVLTAPWHARSSAEIVDRYGARVERDPIPQISALAVPPAGEGQVALFLHEHGALVTAEILADLGNGLQVCPPPVLGSHATLTPFFDDLLGLPIELVLPAHGAPVLEDAHGAVADAIAHFAPRAA